MSELIHRDSSSESEATPAGEEGAEEEEEEVEEPQLSLWICLFLLAAVTVVTGVTAEFLVCLFSIQRVSLRLMIPRSQVSMV